MVRLPPVAATVALVYIAGQGRESHAFVPSTSSRAFGWEISNSRRHLHLGENGEQQAIVPSKRDNDDKQDLVSSPTSLGSNDSWAAALELKKEMTVGDLDAIFHRQQAAEEAVSESSLVEKDKETKDDEAFHRSLLKARLELESKAVDTDQPDTVSPSDVQFQDISEKLDTALDDLADEMKMASPVVDIEAPPQEKLQVAEGCLAHFDNGNDDDDDDESDEDDVDDIVEHDTPQAAEKPIVPTIVVQPSVKSVSKAKKVAAVKPMDKVEDAVAAAVAAVATNGGGTSTTVDSQSKPVNDESTETPPPISSFSEESGPAEESIKIPSPDKETASVSACESSPVNDDVNEVVGEDDAVNVDFWTSITDTTARIMDTFKPQESVAVLKGLDNNVILENAVSHLSKAAIGFGKAALLTFGASFKAMTSPEAADSVQDAATSVSEAAQSISNAVKSGSSSKSPESEPTAASTGDIFMETAKGFRTVTTSFGAVGGVLLRSFGRTKQASEAFEAATESTKECASFVACMVAFGSKKAARAVVRDDAMSDVPVPTETVVLEVESSKGVTEPVATEISVEATEPELDVEEEFVESHLTPTSERMVKDEIPFTDECPSTSSTSPLKTVFAFGAAQRKRAQELVSSLRKDITSKFDGTKVKNENIIPSQDFSETSIKKNPFDWLLTIGAMQSERAQTYLATLTPTKMKESEQDVIQAKTPLDSILNFGTTQGKRAQGYLAKLAGKQVVEEEPVPVDENPLESMMALGTKQSQRAEDMATSLKNDIASKFGLVRAKGTVEKRPVDGLSAVDDMRAQIETIKSRIVKKDEPPAKPSPVIKKNKKSGDDNLFFAKMQ